MRIAEIELNIKRAPFVELDNYCRSLSLEMSAVKGNATGSRNRESQQGALPLCLINWKHLIMVSDLKKINTLVSDKIYYTVFLG